jgi:hypothetical protein
MLDDRGAMLRALAPRYAGAASPAQAQPRARCHNDLFSCAVKLGPLCAERAGASSPAADAHLRAAVTITATCLHAEAARHLLGGAPFDLLAMGANCDTRCSAAVRTSPMSARRGSSEVLTFAASAARLLGHRLPAVQKARRRLAA